MKKTNKPPAQKNKSLYPKPTGDPWQLSTQDKSATVPVPLPVIIVKVEGRYTERDRKLWTFLLHAVWHELPDNENSPLVWHELPVAKINYVFREFGGEHDSQWIWESARRLARTVVEWEDKKYRGIEALFGAAITKEKRAEGVLRFYFPLLLTPHLKNAARFARLRTHFMLGLSGKYAVTLYELLESVANKQNPVLEASIKTLRQWLKVPEGKLTRYQDLRRFALEPALDQINNEPLGAGFTVEMTAMKKGRAFHKVRFTVQKVDERKLVEEKLRCAAAKQKRAKSCKDTLQTDVELAAQARPGESWAQIRARLQKIDQRKVNNE